MSVEEVPFIVECNPSKILDFHIDDGTDPTECVLELGNPGPTPVAFKVKTTKPRRYLVRPNQGCIASGTRLAISIVLLAQEKAQLLHEYRQTGVASETNKFMVQILPLGERDLLPVADAPDKMLAKMSQVWEGAKARMQQKIFVVRFSLRPGLRALLADASETNQGGGSLPGDSAYDGSATATASDAVCFQAGDDEAGFFDGDETSVVRMWQQAMELRQKYNNLVSFTVNLTAEKDVILRSLNATKEELARERKIRKQLQTQMMESGVRPARGDGVMTSEINRTSGFSLFVVLGMSFVSLILGHWVTSCLPSLKL